MMAKVVVGGLDKTNYFGGFKKQELLVAHLSLLFNVGPY